MSTQQLRRPDRPLPVKTWTNTETCDRVTIGQTGRTRVVRYNDAYLATAHTPDELATALADVPQWSDREAWTVSHG